MRTRNVRVRIMHVGGAQPPVFLRRPIRRSYISVYVATIILFMMWPHTATVAYRMITLRIKFNMDGHKGSRLFSLGLLLLFTQSCHYVPLANGQQGKPGF